MTKRHLVEVGFMGVGKTTVGKVVAERLGLAFYDTDEWVKNKTGLSIPEIFAGPGGEPEFREYERAALAAILDQEPGIISTGGGIVSTQLGRNMLMGSGAMIVWLDLDFATINNRVAEDIATSRPLFVDPEKALGLFAVRQTWYAEVATTVVDASRPLEVVINEVMGLVE